MRIFHCGRRVSNAVSINGNFGGACADAKNGGFANALVSAIATVVPALSQVGTNGFVFIAPLKVFAGINSLNSSS